MCTACGLVTVLQQGLVENRILLTQHVATAVLTSSLIGDVCLDAQIHQGEVFNRVVAGINTPDNTESSPIVYLLAQFVQFKAQIWEREILTGDKIAI